MRLLFRAIHARFHWRLRNFHPLDSRIELTRWIVLQKARGHRNKFRLPLFVSIVFHLKQYLDLEVSAPRFKRGFSGPALLGYFYTTDIFFRIQDYYPLWSVFPDCSAKKYFVAPVNRV